MSPTLFQRGKILRLLPGLAFSMYFSIVRDYDIFWHFFICAQFSGKFVVCQNFGKIKR